MAGFEYGNTRLRAMRVRLLSDEQLKGLAGHDRIGSLIDALVRGPYRLAIESVLARASGYPAVAAALRTDFIQLSQAIRSFYSDRARELAGLVWRRLDVEVVKGLLRGVSQNAAPADIIDALLPAGSLSPATVAELARSADPRELIDRLATLGSPFAEPLVALRSRADAAQVVNMDLALERWHIAGARRAVAPGRGEAGSLSEALDFEADLTNLLTVLRLAHSPAGRRLARARTGERGLRELFVGPGRLSFSRLKRAAEHDDLEQLVQDLSETRYGSPLMQGLPDYQRTRRLSEWERRLLRYRLEWSARLIRRDPLGVGVLIGYLALKLNEMRNLRHIALGIELGTPAPRIRRGLELVG